VAKVQGRSTGADVDIGAPSKELPAMRLYQQRAAPGM